MKLMIDHRSFSYAFSYLALCGICIFCTFFFASSNSYFPVALACTIELALFLYFHKKISGELISFASIFMIVLAVFHFGQVFICGFWNDLIKELMLRIVLKYFSDETCLYAMRIINISFVGIGFGLLAKSTYISDIEMDKVSYYDSVENEKRAKLIILFSFPIKLIIDMMFFSMSFSVGFTQAVVWLGNFPDFIRTIGDFSMIGFALWIVALQNNKQKQFRVFAFIMIYLVLMMISGRRSETVSYIAIIAYLYFKSSQRKKRKISTLVLFVIFGYILITFMYTTVRIRDFDNKTIAGFFELFFKLLTKQNIFMEAIREYGNTGYTPICVIANWLNNYPPSYGKSYIFGLAAIFPNVGGLVSNAINTSTYAILLQKYSMVLPEFKNIGGSNIGELFFNFGVVGGIVASPILGMIIGKVSDRVSKYLKTGKVMKLAYLIPIMYASLYWIRDCFGDGIREITWGIAFCYIMNKVVIRESLHNRGE